MEFTLPDISQSFEKTKGFLTEKVGKAANSLSEATIEAKSSVYETAEKVKETITQTTNSAVNSVNQATTQAVTRVSETTNKAVDAVSHSAATAKETLTQTTNSAINTLNQTTSQAVDNLTQATEKAKDSLQHEIQQAENISNAASNALQNAINTTFKNWIDSHPTIVWLLSHPLLTIVMVVLFVFIILGFFQALSGFFAEAWLFILQSPGKFIHWVFSGGSKPVGNLGKVAVNSLVSRNQEENNNSALQLRGVESNSLDSQERLANILTRLDAIRQEQSQLLQEASAILGSQFNAE